MFVKTGGFLKFFLTDFSLGKDKDGVFGMRNDESEHGAGKMEGHLKYFTKSVDLVHN